jgi:thymidylate synthase
MIPDELIGNLGDVHLYSNHVEQAKEQIGRESFKLPILAIINDTKLKFDEFTLDNFKLIKYQSHPSIKAPLSN